MSDHTDTSADGLAALRRHQAAQAAAEADAEREAGVESGAEPGGPEQTREPEPADEPHEPVSDETFREENAANFAKARQRIQAEASYEGLLDLADKDVWDALEPPDLRSIPASAEVVRQLRADVRNLAYRVQRNERNAKLESLFVWGELTIITLVLLLHGRTLGKLVKAAKA